MRGPTSIQRALTARLLAGLLAVLLGTSVGLWLVMRQALQSQFDDALVTKARMLSAFVKRNEQGKLEMELDEAPMPEFEHPGAGESFAVWDDENVVFVSPSLAGQALPPVSRRGPGPVAFHDLPLFDGRPGRMVRLEFVPRTEPTDVHSAPAPAAEQRPLALQLVRERASLDGRLRDLYIGLGLTALVLLLAIPLVIARVIPRSLRPLGDLARRAAAIDAQSLDQRFPTEGLPAELAAIAAGLNELLQRLADGFERERRFSADAAHELRTPIAELRAWAEVALTAPGNAGPLPGGALEDVRDIALQMEGLVTSLLSLSRCQSGHQPVKPELVDLASAIARAWSPLDGLASRRRLQVDMAVVGARQVATDPSLLDSILRNLLGNAVAYTPVGGEITVSTARDSDVTSIAVANTCTGLDETDLPHLSAPFWRKDQARTDGAHSGLGLALVEAIVRLLGGTVTAQLTQPDRLQLVVRLPPAARPRP
jgi:signal transduction histidine kinase